MTRKGPFVLCAAAVAIAAAPALAQGQASAWDVSLGAGPSVPMSKLGDDARTGYHVQGSVGYRTSSLPVGLRVGVFYQDFGAVERESSIHVARGGEWYRQLSAVINATVTVPLSVGPVRPYGLIGAGWLREWHDDITYSGESHATMSLNAGLGLDVPLFGAVGFVEARYMNLLGGDALETGPPAVNPEVEFKSIPVTLGVRLSR